MTRRLALFACTAMLAPALTAGAQISLQTAVSLALKNSPKIRMAQADLDKVRAAHSEAKDAYIPAISTQAGYGQATGAPLNVPIIFSISANSLVFSFSQKDYIRSAEQAVRAAEHVLRGQQIDVVEDTTNTYIALDNALERRKVLREESGFADRLVTVTGQRVIAGVDAQVEVPKARRTATQIRLVALQLEDEIASDSSKLAQLTALPVGSLQTEASSIPQFQSPVSGPQPSQGDSDTVAAAFFIARSKQYAAFGDSRYLLRPQIGLGANYSRVDTGLSSYASYYPRYAGTPENPNSSNALSFGLSITVPLLDMAHRSKARQSAAEAARALAEAQFQQGEFRQGRAKLQNAAAELNLRAELARDEQEIAQDQLDALQVQLQASAGALQGPQTSPKDLLSAQLQERQRYLDLLNVQLQLRQTQVNILRQNDGLSGWVVGPASTPAPSGSQVVQPSVQQPSVPGTSPVGTPAGSSPVGTPAGSSPVGPAPAPTR
jgi:outer membrane protein TolC